MSVADRQKQIEQAEEILGERLSDVGFAKGLFFGDYLAERLLAYPDFSPDGRLDPLLDRLRDFCDRQIDPAAIDTSGEIPPAVIDGLGKLGILGACLPRSCGGLGMSQTSYCRLLEILGAHCGSTALFVNAHHSIGPRALVLLVRATRCRPDAASEIMGQV